MSPIPHLVAIDLDGTLLHSATHTISPGNAAQIRRLTTLGIPVLLASGRRWHTIAAFADQLGLPAATPLIAYNGAMLRTVGGETLFHQPLPVRPAADIVQFCAEHGYHLNYYVNDEWYIRDETPWSRLYQKRTGSVPHVTHDLSRFDGASPTKLLLIDTPANTDRLQVDFRGRYGDTLYIIKTEDEYLEFMHAGVNKSVALERAAARLGVARSDCVAFGDSFNDKEMLEWAGVGVAMGNARPELREIADRIAPSADDDGVASVLREVFPDASVP